MSARLERIARMRPADRSAAVRSFIDGAASQGDLRPLMTIEYRLGRYTAPDTTATYVVGVAINDNGTSAEQLIVQTDSRLPHRLYGISLANLDALELTT